MLCRFQNVFVKYLQIFYFCFRLQELNICSLAKESSQKDVSTMDTGNHSSHRGIIYFLHNYHVQLLFLIVLYLM